MNEDFLHYLWKFKHWQPNALKTTTGATIKIIKTGIHNTNAGPDFTNARVLIGDTEWAGNVEIHLKSSDWKKHKHHNDKAYDNVILHVVFNNDETILNTKGSVIPCFEIKNAFSKDLLNTYKELQESKLKIPCSKQFNNVSPIIINGWLDRMLVERLESKSERIEKYLQETNNNWDEVFYRALLRNFGFKHNDIPFEMLAQNLPFSILAKHLDNTVQIEAMLYGQAGLLSESCDDIYIQTLQNEYAFLAQKFKLKAIDKSVWKFLRMRPVNFPTIRLAQLAHLLSNSKHLFSSLLNEKNFAKAKKMFDAEVSTYWKTHYIIGKESKSSSKKLGEEAINNLFINTVCPMLFVYGKYKGNDSLMDKAQQWLQQIPAENNNVIKQWMDLKYTPSNAFQTQALLGLYTNYCSVKKCLNCAVGLDIIK